MDKEFCYWGLDPSTTSTGLVLLDNAGTVLKSCTVKSKPSGDRPVDEILRIRKIVNEVRTVMWDIPQGYKLGGMAVEGLAFASSMSGHSGLVGLHYLLRDRLEDTGSNPLIVSPTSVKKFVGKGNLKKDEVRLAVYQAFGFEAKSNDEVDAYVLAQIARGMDGYGKWNEKQREVLNLLKKQV